MLTCTQKLLAGQLNHTHRRHHRHYLYQAVTQNARLWWNYYCKHM